MTAHVATQLTARRFRFSWGAALKVAAFALVLALFGRAVAQVDLGRVRALVGRAGFAIALVPIPYFLEMTLDTTAVRALFGVLGRRVPFLPTLGVRFACEAVSASLPAGTVFAESLSP